MTEQATHKACKKCELVKPVSEFYAAKTAKDRRDSSCKLCRNEDGRAYFRANRKKFAERKKLWNIKNKERVKEIKDKSIKLNKEKVIIRSKRYYEKNRNVIIEKKRNMKKLIGIEIVRERARRYGRASVVELKDGYIKGIIVRDTKIIRSEIPDSLVEAKRLNLLISRFIQEH